MAPLRIEGDVCNLKKLFQQCNVECENEKYDKIENNCVRRYQWT